jgi:hypothetical protein
MRKSMRIASAAIGVAALLMAGSAPAAVGAQGGDPGGPPDAGQGPGGGNGGGPGGGNPNPGKSQGKGGLYADLMVIARDANGIPILDGNDCYQPITADASIGVAAMSPDGLYPYGYKVYPVPLVGSAPAAMAEDEDELEVCDPLNEYYASFVSEVDLGRLNLGRSPEKVLLKQLDDVLAALDGATVTVDGSGRLVADGTTVDSPLQNLTVYQSVLETGLVGGLDPTAWPLHKWGLTAAALAAGSPKEGFVITVDTVQYLNRILNIPADTGAEAIFPADLSDDTDEQFLNFGTVPAYSRTATFPGCVAWNQEIFPGRTPTSVMAEVFGTTQSPDGEQNTSQGNVDAYVQFAEDAHQVLVWVHAQGILLDSVDPILSDSGTC